MIGEMVYELRRAYRRRRAILRWVWWMLRGASGHDSFPLA